MGSGEKEQSVSPDLARTPDGVAVFDAHDNA